MGVTKEKKERGKKTKHGKNLGFYKNPKTPRKEERRKYTSLSRKRRQHHTLNKRERDLYEEELGGKTSGTTVAVTTASL